MTNIQPNIRTHIALVGMMGCGKSTVGQCLARALTWPFMDCDTILSNRKQRTIEQLFASEGEAKFRVDEHQLLCELLARTTQSVIATGGGVVLEKQNRQLLHDHSHCIFLEVSVAELCSRIKAQATPSARPLLTGADKQTTLTRIMAERTPLYASVAHRTVYTEQRAPREIAKDLVLWYQKCMGSSMADITSE